MASNEASAETTANDLACTSCRSRKLKCDRVKPTCTRCSRIAGECVYPESRRKPASKRRNVRELEARLAQVEDLLKQPGDRQATGEAAAEAVEIPDFDFGDFVPSTEDVFLQGMDYTVPLNGDPLMSTGPAPFTAADDEQGTNGTFSHELQGLGMSESLPPFEITEDLNRIFFERQQHFIPVIHPVRYMQAYYSAPHMKPPMCLQYAIWALAANGHEQYEQLHDIFYRRARHYAELDELKGHGEHFITVRHAQAWSLITTYEAKSMLFTRAAMSSARAIRLAHMLELHHLDGSSEDLSPTLLPPKDWAELEERRRAFWGIFCLDSHCSISTGWPHLIDPADITTHLPASENAFMSGEAVKTCRLDEAFKGPSYSSFAGAILVCHLFNMILKHVHRPKPNENPENYEYGEYWQRHREIDNTISSAFMFLPEHFRLPENYRDPTATHTNLNYHASSICLHLAALEKIDLYQIPDFAKKASESRLFTAAQEIVNIMKMTSHLKTTPKSPMAAMSLYCAASVFIYQCKDNPSPQSIDNLDFILSAMDAIGREHVITRAFLKQVLLDIDRNGLAQIVRIPELHSSLPRMITVANQSIPLLTRSKLNRLGGGMQPPLPGRLPLGDPQGEINGNTMSECGIGFGSAIKDHGRRVPSGLAPADASVIGDPDARAQENVANKRKRGSPSSSGANHTSASDEQVDQDPAWGQNITAPSCDAAPPAGVRLDSIASFEKSPWASLTRSFTNRLPVRSGSPAVLVPEQSDMNTKSNTQSNSGINSQNLNGAGVTASDLVNWDCESYVQLTNNPTIIGDVISDSTNSWNLGGQSCNTDWDILAQSAGLEMSNSSSTPNGIAPEPDITGQSANPG